MSEQKDINDYENLEIIKDLNKKNDMFYELSTLIQLKGSNHTTYYNNEALKDIKLLLSLNVEIFNFKRSNYDNIKIDFILKLISPLDCFKKREIFSYLIELLKKEGYSEKSKEFYKFLIQENINCSKKNIRNRNKIAENLIKYIHFTITKNIKRLIFTILFLLLIVNIVFLNSPYEDWTCFQIKLLNLSDNIYVNHIANVLTFIFDFEDKMYVQILNIKGLLLMILIKFSLAIIVINYIIKEIIYRIKIT